MIKSGISIIFSGMNYVKFGHFVNYWYVFFGQKCRASLKLTELLRLWGRGTGEYRGVANGIFKNLKRRFPGVHSRCTVDFHISSEFSIIFFTLNFSTIFSPPKGAQAHGSPKYAPGRSNGGISVYIPSQNQAKHLWSNNDVRTVSEFIPQYVIKFYTFPKTFNPPKTYFWLRPCWGAIVPKNPRLSEHQNQIGFACNRIRRNRTTVVKQLTQHFSRWVIIMTIRHKWAVLQLSSIPTRIATSKTRL